MPGLESALGSIARKLDFVGRTSSGCGGGVRVVPITATPTQ